MSKTDDTGETAPTQSDRSSTDEPTLSKRDLLADLREVSRQTSGPLSEREYAEEGTYGVSTFRRRFGSWNAAKREAGLQTRASEQIPEERLLADVKRVARAVDGRLSEREYADRGAHGVSTFRRRFGSWNAAKRQAGLETARREATAEAIADDVKRVADELDDAYVTPEAYADSGEYPLAALPTEDEFWEDLRARVGLSITPLYHKIVD